MRYSATHTTTYRYSQPVTLGHNLLHLAPRELAQQEVHDRDLSIVPSPDTFTAFSDYFGNLAASFTLAHAHDEMVVTHRSELTVDAGPKVDVEDSMSWERGRQPMGEAGDDAGLDALQFVYDSPLVTTFPALREYAKKSFTPGRPMLAAATDLCARVHQDFKYDPTATTIATPLNEVLSARRGVCQDFAHLMIALLRSMGLPSRYVSGYIRTFRKPGNAKSQRLVGADASHAWCELYEPRVGWVGFDPTNDLIPSDMHITVAWGRDYGDVSPIRGVILGGGESEIDVAVEIRPLD